MNNEKENTETNEFLLDILQKLKEYLTTGSYKIFYELTDNNIEILLPKSPQVSYTFEIIYIGEDNDFLNVIDEEGYRRTLYPEELSQLSTKGLTIFKEVKDW